MKFCNIDEYAVPKKKKPYPLHGRSLEIPRGRGVLKVKILEAKYEASWNFLGEGGGDTKQKTFCRGEYGHFLEILVVIKL